MKLSSVIRKVAFLGDYLPRKCGIATFTKDLRCAVASEFPDIQCPVVPVNDLAAGYNYPAEVRFEIAEQDLNDPTRVLGRLREPLLCPNEAEREGYVPNVVYTCGALLHGGELIIPYAMSDSATSFATVSLSELLAAMK